MKIRIIEAGIVSPLYSQAIYHGIAEVMKAENDPVLVILQPAKPYLCIGLHQPFYDEVDVNYCETHDIDIIRRNVGGGTVLLDTNQCFFQFVFPKAKAPNQPEKLYELLLSPVLHTYHHFGIPAMTKSMNDIQVSNKKIGGTGASSINNATVLVGSFLFNFDYQTMAKCVNSPSDNFRGVFEGLLEENMTTISDQIKTPPSVSELVKVFINKVQSSLKVEVSSSELTNDETNSIHDAMSELTEDDWLKTEGRKLVSNGLKVAAGVYLLENAIDFCGNKLIIRVKVEQSIIHTIWLESEDTKIKASLIFVTNSFNITRPNIDEKTLIDLVSTSTSNLESINSEAASTLAKAIHDLCRFTEY